MQIPKEIAEKVERYETLKKESDSLYEAIEHWLCENTEADGVHVEEIFITNEPTGIRQSADGEYCDQISGYCEDDFSGTYYHKIENSDKFVAYNYWC